MPVELKELEVERLMNLARNFGWAKIKEEIQGQNVLVTLEKQIFTKEELAGPLGTA